MAPNYDVYIKVIITRTEVTLNVMTCLMFMMLMEQRCIKVIGSAKKKRKFTALATHEEHLCTL